MPTMDGHEKFHWMHGLRVGNEFKSVLATTHRPFQGAQFIRPVGDETMRSVLANHDDPNDEIDPLSTGSVDNILHPS